MVGMSKKDERLQLLFDMGALYADGKWYLRSQIEDFDEMADKLLDILRKQFSAENGYTSAKLLYQEAHNQLSDFFFYNGSGFDTKTAVFDLAWYLFYRLGYKDNHFVFSNYMHIWQKEPDYPKDLCGIAVKYARNHGNVFTRMQVLEYYEKIGSLSPAQSFSNMIFTTGKNRFLQYDENCFVLAEALDLGEDFVKQLQQQIYLLLDGEDYVAIGDIDDAFYETLPALPTSIYWTPLMLQSVLSQVETGYQTIPARAGTDLKIVHAALVRKGTGYNRFSDVLWE